MIRSSRWPHGRLQELARLYLSEHESADVLELRRFVSATDAKPITGASPHSVLMRPPFKRVARGRYGLRKEGNA